MRVRAHHFSPPGTATPAGLLVCASVVGGVWVARGSERVVPFIYIKEHTHTHFCTQISYLGCVSPYYYCRSCCCLSCLQQGLPSRLSNKTPLRVIVKTPLRQPHLSGTLQQKLSVRRGFLRNVALPTSCPAARQLNRTPLPAREAQ